MRITNCIIYIFILALISVIIHYFYTHQHCSAQYDTSIDPIALVSVLVTIILTVWIGASIAKRMTERRFIKEFIITDIRNIENKLSEFRSLLTVGGDYRDIFNKLTVLNSEIKILKDTLKISESNLHAASITRIESAFTRLYGIATDSDETYVSFVESTPEISAIINGIKTDLRKMVCKINKGN